MKNINKYVAVLITCHNRRDMTLECLTALYDAKFPKNHIMDVFLVDDGCSDGTPSAVKKSYPKVNIIKGTGHLYWNQGMRLAWQSAAKKKDYDFYLWLNDDTFLKKNGLNDLIITSQIKENNAIIVGNCSNKVGVFSYGGKSKNGLSKSGNLMPNGSIQSCDRFNGNLVIIPKSVFLKLGYLCDKYLHMYGDIDYGLSARTKNVSIFSTPSFNAYCESNPVPDWLDKNKTPNPIRRIKIMRGPKGLNMSDYIVFRKKFNKSNWLLYVAKAYFKAIFPTKKK